MTAYVVWLPNTPGGSGLVARDEGENSTASEVESKQMEFGIAICGSANGVAMTANKHKQIRAAICWNPELANLARQHNNANVICLPARFIDIEMAKSCVLSFLTAEFEGGRHQRRVDKIPC